MKISKTTFYSAVYALMGAAAVLLYRQAFLMSTDASGLLVRGSMPEVVLWVLTVCAVLGAVVLSRKNAVGDPGSVMGILGSLIFAAGIYTLLQEPAKGPEALTLMYRGVACLTMVSLAAAAVFRLMGKTPHFVLEIAPALLGILQLVECYQLWSERPLILNYFFGLGAVLCLMMFSYHRMARSAKLPHSIAYPISGLLGTFFCLAAVPQGDFSMFFGAAGLWMAVEMTALTEQEA